MRKKTLLIAGIITIIVGLGGFVYSASAARGFLPGLQPVWGGMMSQEWRDNTRNTVQSGDYSSWRSLMRERQNRMLEWMAPERFSKMAEMRKLISEGKTDEANKIREELGMPALGAGRTEARNAGSWEGGCWR